MTKIITLVLSATIILVSALAAQEPSVERRAVEAVYPGLLIGVLSSATVGQLPDGVLLDMGDKKITQEQLDEIVAKSPAKLKDQIAKNGLFLVQDMATGELLLRAGREWAASAHKDTNGKSEGDVVSDYLQSVAGDVSVSDKEAEEFYAENKDMFDGAKLEDVRGALGQYLRQGKRQKIVDEHMRSLAGRFGVVISASWLEKQAVLARDNPVDKARASGRPTVVDFGADGCRPCDMMAPILKDLREKYKDRANVLFVHVRENPVLGTRYGIQSIPVQVFFDKDGKEKYRHTGFFAQEKIEAKLKELGAK